MILIGQYDSSFVRRAGITLSLYGLSFEHRPWSIIGDADAIRAYNPLTRVPTLVLDDGTVLTESHLIIDYLDSLAPPDRLLCPRDEPDRHRILRVCGLAMGMVDKVVSLFYELRLHEHTSPVWVARCRGQIAATLALLESERAARSGPFWFGDAMSHADIAVTVALRHLRDSHPDLAASVPHPALTAHATHFEAMPVFQTIQQAFIPPA